MLIAAATAVFCRRYHFQFIFLIMSLNAARGPSDDPLPLYFIPQYSEAFYSSHAWKLLEPGLSYLGVNV